MRKWSVLNTTLRRQGPSGMANSYPRTLPRTLGRAEVAAATAKTKHLHGAAGRRSWKFEANVTSVSNSTSCRFRTRFNADFDLESTLVSNSSWCLFQPQFDTAFELNLASYTWRRQFWFFLTLSYWISIHWESTFRTRYMSGYVHTFSPLCNHSRLITGVVKRHTKPCATTAKNKCEPWFFNRELWSLMILEIWKWSHHPVMPNFPMVENN